MALFWKITTSLNTNFRWIQRTFPSAQINLWPFMVAQSKRKSQLGLYLQCWLTIFETPKVLTVIQDSYCDIGNELSCKSEETDWGPTVLNLISSTYQKKTSRSKLIASNIISVDGKACSVQLIVFCISLSRAQLFTCVCVTQSMDEIFWLVPIICRAIKMSTHLKHVFEMKQKIEVWLNCVLIR